MFVDDDSTLYGFSEVPSVTENQRLFWARHGQTDLAQAESI